MSWLTDICCGTVLWSCRVMWLDKIRWRDKIVKKRYKEKIKYNHFITSSLAASSRTLHPFEFGVLNCRKMLLTTRLRMCMKHCVWFVTPGKFSMSMAKCSIILSLLEVLSAVTPSIWVKHWLRYVLFLSLQLGIYLITNTKLFKDFCEGNCEILPWVWFGDFNKVEQHRYGCPFMLKMNHECHIHFVVLRGPCVGGKI